MFQKCAYDCFYKVKCKREKKNEKKNNNYKKENKRQDKDSHNLKKEEDESVERLYVKQKFENLEISRVVVRFTEEDSGQISEKDGVREMAWYSDSQKRKAVSQHTFPSTVSFEIDYRRPLKLKKAD